MQEITAKQVKELRDRTGVGILECRKALEATNGDMEAAIKYLRERGIAKAESKASRQTKEGLIHAYIHFNGRLGVMLELNCESDFVARTEQFKKLAQELALQIAATNPLAITSDQIDPVIIEREREIARNKAINEGKKPEIVEKIVEGTLKKFSSENALLEQELVNEPGITVRDLINSTIAQTGENIQISRFMRYALSEE